MAFGIMIGASRVDKPKRVEAPVEEAVVEDLPLEDDAVEPNEDEQLDTL